MDPINFKSANIVMGKDQSQYLDLPACKEQDGKVTSVWKLTDKERKQIAEGGVVCLCQSTFNNAFQPVNLWVDDNLHDNSDVENDNLDADSDDDDWENEYNPG